MKKIYHQTLQIKFTILLQTREETMIVKLTKSDIKATNTCDSYNHKLSSTIRLNFNVAGVMRNL